MIKYIYHPAVAIIALIIVLATLVHVFIGGVTIFHGIILHSIFLLIGLFLLALYKENKIAKRKKK